MRTGLRRRLLPVLLLAGGCAAGSAWGDVLATARAGNEEVRLDDEPCASNRPGWVIKRAHKRSEGAEIGGCWWVDRRGNPVVRWHDGEVQPLRAEDLVLAPRHQAALRRIDALEAAGAAGAAAPAGFARPAWCAQARAPHERLICRDAQLAAADLALAPLWRAFKTRMQLDEAELRRYKSSFYRRLKACGDDRACVAREQAVRTRLYRIALGLE